MILAVSLAMAAAAPQAASAQTFSQRFLVGRWSVERSGCGAKATVIDSQGESIDEWGGAKHVVVSPTRMIMHHEGGKSTFAIKMLRPDAFSARVLDAYANGTQYVWVRCQ